LETRVFPEILEVDARSTEAPGDDEGGSKRAKEEQATHGAET
jgi:hypothetical protein